MHMQQEFLNASLEISWYWPIFAHCALSIEQGATQDAVHTGYSYITYTHTWAESDHNILYAKL